MPIVEGIVTPTSHFVNEHIRAFENLGPFQNHDLAIQKMQELGVFDRKTTEQVIELQDGTRQTKTIVYQNIVENKWYAYDFENEVFVEPNKYIELIRESSSFIDFSEKKELQPYTNIQFENDGGVFRYDNDFTFACTLILREGFWKQSGKKLTVVKNGANSMVIVLGQETNHPITFTQQENMPDRGVNFFSSNLGRVNKLLVRFKESNRSFDVWVNGRNLTSNPYVLLDTWTTISAPKAGNPNGKLTIGKPTEDVGAYWGESQFVSIGMKSDDDLTNGVVSEGVNNVIMSSMYFTDADVAEFFNLSSEVEYNLETGEPTVGGDAILDSPLRDRITTYLKCGEDEYPNVVDYKSTLIGGVFSGAETGFKTIDEA